jgi:hypothetical protein
MRRRSRSDTHELEHHREIRNCIETKTSSFTNGGNQHAADGRADQSRGIDVCRVKRNGIGQIIFVVHQL